MEVFYATGNAKKFSEAREEIPSLRRLDIDLEEIQSDNPDKIVEQKAKKAMESSNVAALIVDDVAVYLECFDYKLPGPLVKWFLKAIGSAGIYETARRFGRYKAIAECTLYYIDKYGNSSFFKGSVKGTIVESLADSGDSWDSIFMPEGSDITFADMSIPEKNKKSHRGIALRKLRSYLDGIEKRQLHSS